MIADLLRPHVRDLAPYSTARDEFTGQARVYLDANENPFGDGLNRYPDPRSRGLKARASQLKGIDEARIFVGNGSDEAIDLLVRAFVNPGEGVVTTPPTYGMYGVAARGNGVDVFEAPLRPDFSLDIPAIERASMRGGKLIFLCSPNNPTGNQLSLEEIEQLLGCTTGIVVVDEAYIDFAAGPSACALLEAYPRLVVLQTLSKAWGMAAIRVGLAFGDPLVMQALSRLKLPYNINALSQAAALERLADTTRYTGEVRTLIVERERVVAELSKFPSVEHVFPSQGNFLLVRCRDARRLFEFLRERGVIVRDRSHEMHCEGCLRITIGTQSESDVLLALMRDFT
jgi:histidinol-phosphate aminotransferase